MKKTNIMSKKSNIMSKCLIINFIIITAECSFKSKGAVS